MDQHLEFGTNQLRQTLSCSDDKPSRRRQDWKKRPRERLFAKLCGDLVIRVVHEHLDIRLAVSRGGSSYAAFRDPKRQLVADLTSAGDFVLGDLPDKYRFFG